MENHKEIVNLTLRIDKSLKQRFVAVAKENDSDASKELRKFIKEYLIKHSQKKMDF